MEQRRFVHMRDKHLAGQELVLVPENWSGRVHVRSALDGRVVNGGVPRYRQLNCKHLRTLARISRLLRDENTRQSLISAPSSEFAYQLIEARDGQTR